MAALFQLRARRARRRDTADGRLIVGASATAGTWASRRFAARGGAASLEGILLGGRI